MITRILLNFTSNSDCRMDNQLPLASEFPTQYFLIGRTKRLLDLAHALKNIRLNFARKCFRPIDHIVICQVLVSGPRLVNPSHLLAMFIFLLLILKLDPLEAHTF